MSMLYKDLEFSFKETLVLIYLKHFHPKRDTFSEKTTRAFLLKYSLIEYRNNRIFLSDKARMYLRFKRKDNFRFWLPIVISIIALLAGYDVYTIPLLKEILEVSVSLLKTIVESLGAFF